MESSNYAYIKGNIEEANQRMQLEDFNHQDLETVKTRLQYALDKIEEETE